MLTALFRCFHRRLCQGEEVRLSHGLQPARPIPLHESPAFAQMFARSVVVCPLSVEHKKRYKRNGKTIKVGS